MRRSPGLAARLLAVQVLVIVVGGVTLALVTALIAPGIFHAHLGAAVGRVDPVLDRHVDEAFRASFLVSLLVALVAAGTAAAGVSWLATRRASRTFSMLAASARRVAHGDYRARVARTGLGPEFDALRQSFNAMAVRLEATETIRRRLLADVAHELRTPLATIDACLEGIADGVLPADTESWSMLTAQTTRMRRLVDDIADVSRAEEGRLALQPRAVAAADLVGAAVAAARPAYVAKGVALHEQVEPGAGPVRVDPDRMQQVLGNLLGNALRHTAPGGRVDVSLRPPGVRIRVADTGDGIPAEHLPLVFDRFHRVDAARSRAAGGSGIGLTITRALVHAHGGEITATSAGVGAGATFEIWLPP